MFAETSQFNSEFIAAKNRKSRRLMVVLHGRGDSLKPFRELPDELGLSNMNYLLINAPRKYDGGYTWYGFPPRQARGVLLARKRLALMMDEIKEQGWKTKDVYFFGFSQGALVSVDFGLNYQEQLGGIIGISGYIYFFPRWRTRIPRAAFKTKWLLTHGLKDDALEIDHSRLCANKLKEAGLPIKWLEFDKDHEIDQEEEVPEILNFLK